MGKKQTNSVTFNKQRPSETPYLPWDVVGLTHLWSSSLIWVPDERRSRPVTRGRMETGLPWNLKLRCPYSIGPVLWTGRRGKGPDQWPRDGMTDSETCFGGPEPKKTPKTQFTVKSLRPSLRRNTLISHHTPVLCLYQELDVLPSPSASHETEPVQRLYEQISLSFRYQTDLTECWVHKYWT